MFASILPLDSTLQCLSPALTQPSLTSRIEICRAYRGGKEVTANELENSGHREASCQKYSRNNQGYGC